MFPGSQARIYTNEVGEVIGWDYPSYDEDPGYDDDDWHMHNSPEPESVEECKEWKLHGKDGYGDDGWWICDYCHEPYAEIVEKY